VAIPPITSPSSGHLLCRRTLLRAMRTTTQPAISPDRRLRRRAGHGRFPFIVLRAHPPPARDRRAHEDRAPGPRRAKGHGAGETIRRAQTRRVGPRETLPEAACFAADARLWPRRTKVLRARGARSRTASDSAVTWMSSTRTTVTTANGRVAGAASRARARSVLDGLDRRRPGIPSGGEVWVGPRGKGGPWGSVEGCSRVPAASFGDGQADGMYGRVGLSTPEIGTESATSPRGHHQHRAQGASMARPESPIDLARGPDRSTVKVPSRARRTDSAHYGFLLLLLNFTVRDVSRLPRRPPPRSVTLPASAKVPCRPASPGPPVSLSVPTRRLVPSPLVVFRYPITLLHLSNHPFHLQLRTSWPARWSCGLGSREGTSEILFANAIPFSTRVSFLF